MWIAAGCILNNLPSWPSEICIQSLIKPHERFLHGSESDPTSIHLVHPRWPIGLVRQGRGVGGLKKSQEQSTDIWNKVLLEESQIIRGAEPTCSRFSSRPTLKGPHENIPYSVQSDSMRFNHARSSKKTVTSKHSRNTYCQVATPNSQHKFLLSPTTSAVGIVVLGQTLGTPIKTCIDTSNGREHHCYVY